MISIISKTSAKDHKLIICLQKAVF